MRAVRQQPISSGSGSGSGRAGLLFLPRRLLLLAAAVVVVFVVRVQGHDSETPHSHSSSEAYLSFDFAILNGTALPKPLSDLTATLYGGTVYLAGGCDAEDGNAYSDAIRTFVCSSASASLYGFSYRTLEVQELAAMPVPRYRHAAVAVNGGLWLVGGRDTQADSIIGQVDVRTCCAMGRAVVL